MEQELHRLHYTEGTIRYYRRMWGRIAAFLGAERAPDFTEDLGVGVLDQQFDLLSRQEAGTLTEIRTTTPNLSDWTGVADLFVGLQVRDKFAADYAKLLRRWMHLDMGVSPSTSHKGLLHIRRGGFADPFQHLSQ